MMELVVRAPGSRRPTLRRWFPLLLLLGSLFFHPDQSACAGSPVVKAILFYSPTCPHCHRVITEDLPPLMDTYGDQLQIVAVDVSTPGGQELYQAAVARYSIPAARQGVPTVVIGDVVLVGDVEIPEQFPGLVQTGLAQGGVDWPDIPGLREALGELPEETAAPPASPMQNLNRDPVGNGLSVVVLVGMIVSVAYVTVRLLARRFRPSRARGGRAIPYLSLIGVGTAGYLAAVEWSGNPAVCGPIGDCNAVQASPAAMLMGVFPVAWVGVTGYVTILVVWLYGRRRGGRTEDLSGRAVLAMAGVGTLYSIYLTYLEPFVIGATCAWCLASAVIMTLILLAASAAIRRPIRPPASRAAPGARQTPTI